VLEIAAQNSIPDNELNQLDEKAYEGPIVSSLLRKLTPNMSQFGDENVNEFSNKKVQRESPVKHFIHSSILDNRITIISPDSSNV